MRVKVQNLIVTYFTILEMDIALEGKLFYKNRTRLTHSRSNVTSVIKNKKEIAVQEKAEAKYRTIAVVNFLACVVARSSRLSNPSRHCALGVFEGICDLEECIQNEKFGSSSTLLT